MSEQYYGIRVGITGADESAAKLQRLSQEMQKIVRDYENYNRAVDNLNRQKPGTTSASLAHGSMTNAGGALSSSLASYQRPGLPPHLSGIDPSVSMMNNAAKGARIFDETFKEATRRMATEIQQAINKSAGNFEKALERAAQNSLVRLGTAQSNGGALEATMAHMLRVFESRGYTTPLAKAPDPKAYENQTFGAEKLRIDQARYEEARRHEQMARQFGASTDRSYAPIDDPRLLARIENSATAAAKLLETTFQKITGTPFARHDEVKQRDPDLYLRAMGISQVNAAPHYQAVGRQLQEYERLTNMGVDDTFAWSRSFRARDQYLQRNGEDPSLSFQRPGRQGFGGFIDDFTGGRGAGGYLGRSAFRTATYVGEGSLLYGAMGLGGGALRDILTAQEHQLRTTQIVGSPVERSRLSGGLEGLSRKYGVLPSEAYDVGFNMQAQFQSPTQALKGTEAVLLLTKTATVSLADAMKDLVAITNNYGTGAKGMQDTVNGLVAVQNKFGGSIEQNIQALSRLGPLFKEYGIDQATGTAYIQTIQKKTGTSGLEAASKLERVLPQLQNKNTQEILASIGVQTGVGVDATSFLGDINGADILSKFGQGYQDGRVNDTQLSRIVVAMGGARNAADVVPLVTDKAMIDKIKQTDLQGINDKSAEARFATVSQSALQQLAQLKSDFITLVKGVADSGILQAFTDLLKLMNALTSRVAGLVGIMNQLVSALGPLGGILKDIIGVSLVASVGGKYLNSSKLMGETLMGGMIGRDAVDTLGQNKREMTRRQYWSQVFGPAMPIDSPNFNEQRLEHADKKAAAAARLETAGLVGNEPLIPGASLGAAAGASAVQGEVRNALSGNFARFVDGMSFLALGPLKLMGDAITGVAGKLRLLMFSTLNAETGRGFGTGGMFRTGLENFAVYRAVARGGEEARAGAQAAAGSMSSLRLLAGPAGLAVAAGAAGYGAFKVLDSFAQRGSVDAKVRGDRQREIAALADSFKGINADPTSFGGVQRGELYSQAARDGDTNYANAGFWNHAGRLWNALENGGTTGADTLSTLRFNQVDWSKFSKDDLKKLDVKRNKDGTFTQDASRMWGLFGSKRKASDFTSTKLAAGLGDLQSQKDQDAWRKSIDDLAKANGGTSALPVELLDFMHQQDMFSSTFGGGRVDFTGNAGNSMGKSGMRRVGSASTVETLKNTQDEIRNLDKQMDIAIAQGRDDKVKDLVKAKQKAMQDLDTLKNAVRQSSAAIGAFFGDAGVGAAMKAAADAASYKDLIAGGGDPNSPEAVQRRLAALQSQQQAISAPFDSSISAAGGLLGVTNLTSDKVGSLQASAQLAQQKAQAILAQVGDAGNSAVQKAMIDSINAYKAVLDATNQAALDGLSAQNEIAQAKVNLNPLKKNQLQGEFLRKQFAQITSNDASVRGLVGGNTGNPVIDSFIKMLTEQANKQKDDATAASDALKQSGTDLSTAGTNLNDAATSLKDAAAMWTAALGGGGTPSVSQGGPGWLAGGEPHPPTNPVDGATSAQDAYLNHLGIAAAAGQGAGGGRVTGTKAQFLNAIASEESGSYSAVGPMVNGDRAYGKYQVMGNNIASWSKEALGHAITIDQFRTNPDLQEKIVQHKLGGYFDQYGAAGAASAWFTGDPRTYLRNPGASDGHENAATYVSHVLAAMGGQPTTVRPGVTGPGGVPGVGGVAGSLGSGLSPQAMQNQAQQILNALERQQIELSVRQASRITAAGPVMSQAQAQASLVNARDAVKTLERNGAKNTEAWYRAVTDLNKAMYDFAMNNGQLIIAKMRLFGDSTNPVQAAQAQLATTQYNMRAFLNAGGKKNSLEYTNLAATAKEQGNQVNQAQTNLGLQDLSYAYSMHRLGFGEYIQKLTDLRDHTKTNTRAGLELWRSINQQIQGLVDGLGMNFNIPTAIKTPTLYMVRRSLGPQGLGPGGMYPSGIAAPLGPSGQHAASGGSSNGAVLVGENGPEWFVPSVPGVILPYGEKPGGAWHKKYTMAHPGSGQHAASGGYTTSGINPRNYIENQSSQNFANGDPRMGGLSGIIFPGAEKTPKVFVVNLKEINDELKKVEDLLEKLLACCEEGHDHGAPGPGGGGPPGGGVPGGYPSGPPGGLGGNPPPYVGGYPDVPSPIVAPPPTGPGSGPGNGPSNGPGAGPGTGPIIPPGVYYPPANPAPTGPTGGGHGGPVGGGTKVSVPSRHPVSVPRRYSKHDYTSAQLEYMAENGIAIGAVSPLQVHQEATAAGWKPASHPLTVAAPAHHAAPPPVHVAPPVRYVAPPVRHVPSPPVASPLHGRDYMPSTTHRNDDMSPDRSTHTVTHIIPGPHIPAHTTTSSLSSRTQHAINSAPPVHHTNSPAGSPHRLIEPGAWVDYGKSMVHGVTKIVHDIQNVQNKVQHAVNSVPVIGPLLTGTHNAPKGGGGGGVKIPGPRGPIEVPLEFVPMAYSTRLGSTPLPPRSAKTDLSVMGIPESQWTARQKEYAEQYGLSGKAMKESANQLKSAAGSLSRAVDKMANTPGASAGTPVPLTPPPVHYTPPPSSGGSPAPYVTPPVQSVPPVPQVSPPAPARTTSMDAQVKGKYEDQWTAAERAYADSHGLSGLGVFTPSAPPPAAPAPAAPAPPPYVAPPVYYPPPNPAPNAPGGLSYVGSPENTYNPPAPAYVPPAPPVHTTNGDRAFSSFSAASQAILKSGGTVVGGDGRVFTMEIGADGTPHAFARAAGGPVRVGGAYRVGENGPETFVPTSNGAIVPADVTGMMTRGLAAMRANGISNMSPGGHLGGVGAQMLASGGQTRIDASRTEMTNNVTIHAGNADAKEVARLVARAIGQGVSRNARRNGSYTGAR